MSTLLTFKSIHGLKGGKGHESVRVFDLGGPLPGAKQSYQSSPSSSLFFSLFPHLWWVSRPREVDDRRGWANGGRVVIRPSFAPTRPPFAPVFLLIRPSFSPCQIQPQISINSTKTPIQDQGIDARSSNSRSSNVLIMCLSLTLRCSARAYWGLARRIPLSCFHIISVL